MIEDDFNLVPTGSRWLVKYGWDDSMEIVIISRTKDRVAWQETGMRKMRVVETLETFLGTRRCAMPITQLPIPEPRVPKKSFWRRIFG